MDIFEIKSEIENHYTSKHGTVTVHTTESGETIGDGNNLLHTGFYYAALNRNGALTQVDIEKGKMILVSHMKNGTPMLWRSPEKSNPDDDQQADDYYGALVISKLSWFIWSVDFVRWSIDHDWSIDIQAPSKWSFRYWFGRFPAFPACVQAAAGVRLKAHQIVLAAFSFATGSIDGDSVIKAYCQRECLEGQSAFLDYFVSRYFQKVKERGGVGKFVGDYFGKDHPLTKINYSK